MPTIPASRPLPIGLAEVEVARITAALQAGRAPATRTVLPRRPRMRIVGLVRAWPAFGQPEGFATPRGDSVGIAIAIVLVVIFFFIFVVLFFITLAVQDVARSVAIDQPNDTTRMRWHRS
jgi:hypothetical protein